MKNPFSKEFSSVDEILKIFNKTVDALRMLAEREQARANAKLEKMKAIEVEAVRHSAEAERAERISAKLEDILK